MVSSKHLTAFTLIPIFLLLTVSKYVVADTINTSEVKDSAIGQHIEYFQESSKRLTVEQAMAIFNQGIAKQSTSDSISLGIGVAPVWLKFTVNQNALTELGYRLSIETPWLDEIDTYLVHQKKVTRHVAGGDKYPFEQRPMDYRFYAFEHQFDRGKTDVYMRVESLGPMAIPVRLSTIEKSISRDIASGYQYGFLYGIMSALALYNLVLFAFVRQKEYGLYGLYLLGFVLNSLSYTGQIHAVYTPDFGPYFQDWVDIFLMITYSVAGLHFARHLLATKNYAPKLDKFVINITMVIPAGMIIGLLLNQLVFSITLAFILNCGFVLLFIAMGIYALKVKRHFAVIFLCSSVIGALCITISTLAVAGLLIPYNDYTFKAIEVGMAVEAILLATILARQFRMAKMDKYIAEQIARSDSLTDLNNRHGFKEITDPIWQTALREKRDCAVVLIDVDDFKLINDTYSHASGDKALQNIARCIEKTIRKGDVAARWGGEEFIVFLPETTQKQAIAQAERLRRAIERTMIMVSRYEEISLTASLGVAGSAKGAYMNSPLRELSLEFFINQADTALYRAKKQGKNSVRINI